MNKTQQLELFGSDSEDEDGFEPASMASSAPGGAEYAEERVAGGSTEDDIGENELFGSDDDDGDGPIPHMRAPPAAQSEPPLHYELPILPKPKPDAELYHIRIPNILAIEPRPFIAEEYDPEIGADGQKVEEQGEKTENVIRWRENAETGMRESNTRVVTWSDGSMTLHVGGEVLSAAPHKIDGSSQLFSRHKGSNLECHGLLKKKLVLQPASIKSSTHKALTQRIAKAHVKHTIKMHTTTQDPEKKKREDEKLWDEKQRMQMRQSVRGSQQDYATGVQELSADFLDDDDDVGEGNLGAIKRRFSSKAKAKGRAPPVRTQFGGKRPRGLSPGRPRGEDSSDEVDEDNDDDEEEDGGDPREMEDFIVGDEDEDEDEDYEEGDGNGRERAPRKQGHR